MPTIGCRHVATEMEISQRAAYELVRRLGVPILWGDGIRGIRFDREAFEDLRARAAKPLPERKGYGAGATPREATTRGARNWRERLKEAGRG